MNKRGIGSRVEEIVTKYLCDNGVNILTRNYETKHGEIDIVGQDGEYLVFFEVKYRSDLRYGNPLEAVTYSKQRSIYNAARVYLYMHHYPENTFIRFDCIGVMSGQIQWIKNAF